MMIKPNVVVLSRTVFQNQNAVSLVWREKFEGLAVCLSFLHAIDARTFCTGNSSTSAKRDYMVISMIYGIIFLAQIHIRSNLPCIKPKSGSACKLFSKLALESSGTILENCFWSSGRFTHAHLFNSSASYSMPAFSSRAFTPFTLKSVLWCQRSNFQVFCSFFSMSDSLLRCDGFRARSIFSHPSAVLYSISAVFGALLYFLQNRQIHSNTLSQEHNTSSGSVTVHKFS